MATSEHAHARHRARLDALDALIRRAGALLTSQLARTRQAVRHVELATAAMARGAR